MKERDELNHQLVELSRERDNLNTCLQEMSSETERVRDDLNRVSSERTMATEERDRSISEKDSQIQELQRRLREMNTDILEHHTNTFQILLSLGSDWNIPREEIKIFHDREIGHGASGLVVEGSYQNQRVAIKQIHHDILENKTIMKEFRREIGIMASVKHPNLVNFIAAVFDDNVLETPLLVLELLHTNLRKAYQDDIIKGQQLKLSIFRDVAYGLHYLHEHRRPIIHRDLSSPNVLLEALSGGLWRAKLSCFGSANFLKTLRVGAVVYTAPEMFPQEGLITPIPHPTTKCDVFSYGIVLVEVITKTMPTTENRHQLFSKVGTKWPLMHDLASKCTETVPEARPPMSEVLNTLNRIPNPALKL